MMAAVLFWTSHNQARVRHRTERRTGSDSMLSTCAIGRDQHCRLRSGCEVSKLGALSWRE
jgi:hypothetical protein